VQGRSVVDLARDDEDDVILHPVNEPVFLGNSTRPLSG
jgi:hypothetical protein